MQTRYRCVAPLPILLLAFGVTGPAVAARPLSAAPGRAGGETLDCPGVVADALASTRERPPWAVSGVPDHVWRLADAASVADEDARRCLLEVADTVATRAVVARPDEVAPRFALAVVLGLRADREGGRTKVRAASRLHEELRAILGLDPDHAPARHLLGRLHAGVMRMDGVVRWIATHLLGGGALSEASWGEAERNLRFAEERAPDVLDHHFELARLLQDTDRDAEAAEELRHVLALPVASDMEEAVRERAARLLAELSLAVP